MFFDNTVLDVITRALLLPAIGLLWVVLLVRLSGLRSFSKMTNFDFVTTVAMGSLLAGMGMTDKWADASQIMIAMAGLFAVQATISRVRRDSDAVEDVLQNKPVLLMEDGKINDEALKQCRVAESDVIAKLREANVMHFDEVCAVVLETTGDISVLHGEKLDEELLRGVQRL